MLMSVMSCGGKPAASGNAEDISTAGFSGSGSTVRSAAANPDIEKLKRILDTGRFPSASVILAAPETFLAELAAVLDADTDGLLVLVDKMHYLDAAYVPQDLVSLEKGASYIPNRAGLSLRRPAEQALERMAAASLRDGVTLVASSTYRSYEYQEGVYGRNVRELGQAAADRESARPGTSQHQLGTVVDFGSITDDFAETKAGRWLAANAGDFGFSLSFPDGYEDITGYRWECWHYRYIGKEAAALQKKYFGDIQQYMMEFIDMWKRP